MFGYSASYAIQNSRNNSIKNAIQDKEKGHQMSFPIEDSIFFTAEENALIQDSRFFETKARVSQKVKTLLKQIHIALKKEIPRDDLLVPEGFNPANFQFVKGEHLLECPYRYLDFPKHFKNKDMLTFRTLFWWGHFFVFALILEGRHLDQYKRSFLSCYTSLADRGFFILMTDRPWEWRLESKYLLEIRTENQRDVARALESRPFLKIHRYLSFEQAAVLEGKVAEEALKTFRMLRPLLRLP